MVSIFRDDLDNFGHQFHPFPFPKNLSRGTPDFCSQPQLFLLGWLSRFRDFLNRLMCTIAVRKPSIPQLTIPNGGDGHRWAIKIVVLGTQIIPFSGVAVWNPFKHLIFDDIYVIVCRFDLVYEILVTVGIPILDKRVFAKIRYVFWEPAVPRSSIRYLDGWRLDHLENTTFT